jgi:hypothetical protein
VVRDSRVVADRGARAARVGDGPGAGGVGGIRGMRRGEKNRSGFRKGVNEPSRKVLKTRVIY